MPTALILEEIPEMRRLFRVLLERLGLHVREAASAEEAFEAAAASAELALLVATQQPGDQSRRDAIGTLVRTNPAMAVVVTSGYTLTPHELPSGAVFFQKPFHPGEFTNTLALLVSRSR